MRVFVVDAFADQAFAGHPAGVVLLGEGSPDPGALEPGVVEPGAGWMQALARELGFPETAFVDVRALPFGLRWFTPAVEVDLCGHATLASAHILHEVGLGGETTFATRSGELSASVNPHGWVTLDFPATPVHPVPVPSGLAEALGVEIVEVHGAGEDLLVEVAGQAQVAALVPDLRVLAAVECRGVIVTAAADPSSGVDLVSRFFAPQVGIDEDPVTGSAHCALGPFWARRLGRAELAASQLSARGGRIDVEVRGDRVLLRGRAVTVLAGALGPAASPASR
jgi:PhzF family phenazine biosynthesis protein